MNTQFYSKLPTGEQVVVSVSIEQPTGVIEIRKWTATQDTRKDKPVVSSYKLYDVSVGNDGVLTCRADVPGSNPTLTITLSGVITLDIHGTTLKAEDGTTKYDVSIGDLTSLHNLTKTLTVTAKSPLPEKP